VSWINCEKTEEADRAHVREEVGVLLCVVTNIARRLNVEPEAALKLANRKFRRRFSWLEKELATRRKTFDATTIDELESLWQEAKHKERAGSEED
jgi:uncharacterized protein YabN with tetrapyrrole methylase and pyrophosphatase domain